MSDKVTVGDLKEAPEGAMLYCPICGSEYSANYHDYFLASDRHVFKCCHRNMMLVFKRTIYESVYEKV